MSGFKRPLFAFCHLMFLLSLILN